MSAPAIDYDGLMQANLTRVFSEPDADRREDAIGELYAHDAVFYEPDSVATGSGAIARAVTALLASLPPTFTFTALGPAVGHHGLARLRWRAGPLDGPAAVTGTDVVRIVDGRLQTLHVFIDPPGA